MFASFGDCGRGVQPFGLRGIDDGEAVLVCPRHLENLTGLRHREAEKLGEYLALQFGRLEVAS